jgi:hypothetical protein
MHRELRCLNFSEIQNEWHEQCLASFSLMSRESFSVRERKPPDELEVSLCIRYVLLYCPHMTSSELALCGLKFSKKIPRACQTAGAEFHLLAVRS